MKRIIGIFLCVLLALSTVACSSEESINDETTGENESKGEENLTVESDKPIEEVEEITIIFPNYMMYTDFPATLDYYKTFLTDIKEQFEEKEGIKVNIETVSGSDYTEYISNREQEMKTQDSPELVFIHVWSSCNDMINNGTILNVKDDLSNMSNLYEGFRTDYFVPAGVYYANLTLKRDMLESYGIDEPNYDWNSDDYFKIRDRWLEDEELEIKFNIDEYWNTVKLTWNDIDIYNEETKSIDLDNEEVKAYIKMLRNNLLSTGYILDEEYTVENYYNMFNNLRSEEATESISIMQEQFDKHFLMSPYEYRRNLLNSLNSNTLFSNSNAVVVPDIVEYGKVYGWGFVVNKNGKNLETSMKFLDYMLSDEVQLEIYHLGISSDGMAPVSKEIEDEIASLEKENNILENASYTRKYIIDKVNQGDYRLKNVDDSNEMLKIQFAKKIVKYIFSDEAYTDEELSISLRELEKELSQK